MKRPNLKFDVVPLSEFRANAAAMVQQAKDSKRPLVVTQRGKASVVVLDVEEYEKLLEQIDFDKALVGALADAMDDEGVSTEQAKAEILAEFAVKTDAAP